MTKLTQHIEAVVLGDTNESLCITIAGVRTSIIIHPAYGERLRALAGAAKHVAEEKQRVVVEKAAGQTA